VDPKSQPKKELAPVRASVHTRVIYQDLFYLDCANNGQQAIKKVINVVIKIREIDFL